MANGAFRDALARLEQALAGSLEVVNLRGTPDQIERVIRLLIKKEIVMELLLDEIGPGVSYGTFWQSQFLTVPFNQPFSFNNTGPTAGGVSLLNPTTVSIVEPGDYRVTYHVSYFGGTANPDIPVVSLRLNNAA